ncbi:MAG: hypothetical protein ABJK11_04190 [Balneola sp.]
MLLQVDVQKARAVPFILLCGASKGSITSLPVTGHSLLDLFIMVLLADRSDSLFTYLRAESARLRIKLNRTSRL